MTINNRDDSICDFESLLVKIAQIDSFLKFNEMEPILKALHFNQEETATYFCPNPNRYHRKHILRTPYLEVIAITWLSGQESPIHDHASSACGVKVITGEAIESVFSIVNSNSEAVQTKTFNRVAGDVFGGGFSDVHKIANVGVLPLHTIHIYSPPLTEMQVFETVRDGLCKGYG